MIEKERIASMVQNIERYFADLDTIHLENRNDLEIPEKRHAISMLVFSIMNRTIDIVNELIAGSKLPVPGSYRDTFDILEKARILNPKTAAKMVELVKYRSIIAHEYYILASDELYRLKKRIFDVQEFLEDIKRYLK